MARSSAVCSFLVATMALGSFARAATSEQVAGTAGGAAPLPPAVAVTSQPATAPEPAADVPLPATVDASGEKVVAVLDLKVDGDVAGLANALAAMIASDVSGRPGLRAVSRNELRSVIANAADAQLLGCESMNCLSDIARLADAAMIVSGTLGLVDGSQGATSGGPALVLALSLIDASGPAVVARADATWRGKPEEFVTAVPAVLDRLFDGAAAATYVGAIEVFAPDGATVAVDGAAAQVGKNVGLPIGVRTVEVSQPGYQSQRIDVAVLRNATSVVRVELEPEPFYTQWWFWTAVGVGTGAAVVGGVVVADMFTAPTVLKVNAPLPSALTR